MTALGGALVAELRPCAATAVIEAGVPMSYEELLSAARSVADALRDRGAGPGAVVPIQAKPTGTAIVHIVGTLLTGAAYAPIDVRIPPLAAARMARLCGSPFILSDADRSLDGVNWLAPSALKRADDRARFTASVPEDTTYVIFTSGSTGAPKGVVVPDEAVRAYLDWSMREYEVVAGFGAPLMTSLGFDLTVTSLLGPLAFGRRIDIHDPARWPLHVATQPELIDGASFVKLTPSQVNLVCDLLEEQGSSCLVPRLIVGGEAMYGQSVARWRRSFPAAAIVNEYGPTEATVGCCRFTVPPDFRGNAVPIGTPPDAMALTIAAGSDDSEGELIISGVQVAIGYLDDDGSSGKGFLERFPIQDSVRSYRSGDRVCRSIDGTFTYLGRIGREVKVNGFRVNLAAIESLLNACRGVMSAAVEQSADGGLRALVVVPDGDTTVDNLLAKLRETLPQYAVPPVIQIVPRAETTERGKMRAPPGAVLSG